MGLGSTVKAIWQLLQGTTNPDVVALYNYLYQKLEGAKLFAPQGMGNVYFVNGGADGVTVGSNANNGKTPATAFLTIAYAISQCVNNNNDYIFCFNVYAQEVFPITLNLDCLHIIGLDAPDGNYYTLDAANSLGGAVDDAVFTFAGGLAQNCEIAGFMLEGGATHAAIELVSGANQTWIHNCTFGHYWCVAGQDGISNTPGVGGSVWNLVVENCWFYGSSGPCGKLSRYGIFNGAQSWGGFTIRNNYFLGVPTGAIILGGTGAAHEGVIDHNCIGCGADALGNAITLDAQSNGCLVQSNEAAHGSAALMTAAPYSDVLAADENHWASNQAQDQMVLPNEVPT